MAQRSGFGAAFLFVLFGCLALGCGDGKSYRVSGTVTFAGKSVPEGKIYFNPDTSKGNSGPSGYANIVNGSFDTSAAGGQGSPPGPVVVQIEGFTDVAPSGDVTKKPLFFPFTELVEIPKEASTRKFDVPASAANKPQAPKGGPVIVP